MATQVGHLFKKRTVKRLDGSIIDLVDEANGGYIIRSGRVVDEVRYAEVLQKEEDRRKAALAMTEAISVPKEVVAQRTQNPVQVQRMDDLENKIKAQDEKLDAILKALAK